MFAKRWTTLPIWSRYPPESGGRSARRSVHCRARSFTCNHHAIYRRTCAKLAATFEPRETSQTARRAICKPYHTLDCAFFIKRRLTRTQLTSRLYVDHATPQNLRGSQPGVRSTVARAPSPAINMPFILVNLIFLTTLWTTCLSSEVDLPERS